MTPSAAQIAAPVQRGLCRLRSGRIGKRRWQVRYRLSLIVDAKVPSKQVLFEEIYTLTSFESAHTPSEEFELTARPGTLVGDDRLPTADKRPEGLLHYEMPASADDLDAAIQHAIDGTTFIPSELRTSTGNRVILITINVIVILAIVLTVFLRSRRLRV